MALDPLLQSLVAGFLAEAEEISQKLTRAALTLERGAEPPATLQKLQEEVARGLHTLKGSAATLGLDDVARIAHQLEDCVAPGADQGGRMPEEVANALLGGLDLLLTRTQGHVSGMTAGLPPMDEALDKLLSALRNPAKAAPAPATERRATPRAEPAASTDADENHWRVSAPQVTAMMRETERLREGHLRLEERRKEVERCLLELRRVKGGVDPAELELQLYQLERGLLSDAQAVADVVDSLEEGIREICTRPVSSVTEPLFRAVRDLARAGGKEARLSIVGGEVSLDRRVLEALRGPLSHLIRNAVDHGLETPAERAARGKHAEGGIVVRVEQQGNLTFVEVSDDGRGLDAKRIAERAVALKLLTPGDASTLAPAQAFEFIFRAGFSTREKVSETSGRGVGLDAVKSDVQALGGRLEVDSTPHQGTSFTLTLPSAIGSAPLLMVRCNEHTFGLPMVGVERIFPARPLHLQGGSKQMKFEHEGRLVPLFDLGQVLKLRQALPPYDGQPILQVQSQGRRVGVVVDAVLGNQDMAIRPLPAFLRRIPAFEGAATLARGDLMLILRPDWLTSLSAQATDTAPTALRALVVDDSLTVRALHRAMLEAGGFAVHVVPSALEALDRLQRILYDVVVCDVGMQGMSGLDFTAALRRASRTAGLPVVLVSAHDGPPEREQGRLAGADAFLSKRECVEGRLLAEVQGVLARKGRRS